ncbi:hypothetical protein D3C75_1041320 [compost metagenome]
MRTMIYFADHFAELPVGHGIRGGGIDRACDFRGADTEIDQPGDILKVDPGEPLLPAANPAAEAKGIGQLHFRESSALVAEHYTCTQFDQPYPLISFVRSGFPGLNDL